MKNYICPIKGYIINLENIRLDKSVLVVCQNPNTKEYIRLYVGTATLGNNLLMVDGIDTSKRWLEPNPEGRGFIEFIKWRDGEATPSQPITEVEILVDENLNSPDIYQFPTDDDAKLFMDLIGKEGIDDDECRESC